MKDRRTVGLIIVYIFSFVAFSIGGTLVLNAPLWAIPIVALALIVSGLFPPLLIMLIAYIVIGAFMKIAEWSSILALVSFAVFAVAYFCSLKIDS